MKLLVYLVYSLSHKSSPYDLGAAQIKLFLLLISSSFFKLYETDSPLISRFSRNNFKRTILKVEGSSPREHSLVFSIILQGLLPWKMLDACQIGRSNCYNAKHRYCFPDLRRINIKLRGANVWWFFLLKKTPYVCIVYNCLFAKKKGKHVIITSTTTIDYYRLLTFRWGKL